MKGPWSSACRPTDARQDRQAHGIWIVCIPNSLLTCRCATKSLAELDPAIYRELPSQGKGGPTRRTGACRTGTRSHR